MHQVLYTACVRQALVYELERFGFDLCAPSKSWRTEISDASLLIAVNRYRTLAGPFEVFLARCLLLSKHLSTKAMEAFK
jgi:hypothetical protein